MRALWGWWVYLMKPVLRVLFRSVVCGGADGTVPCTPRQSLPLFIHLGSSGIAGAFLYRAAVNAAMPEPLLLFRVSCDGAFGRL